MKLLAKYTHPTAGYSPEGENPKSPLVLNQTYEVEYVSREQNTTVMTELAITETEAVTETQATISETTCSEELLSTAEIVTETVVSEIETAEVLNLTTYDTANE